jgi:hypothetical protein
MAALPVTEDLTEPREVNHPAIEIVEWTSQSTADYYLSKKFGQIDAAFASQESADGREVQVSWANESTGQPKVTLAPASAATTGYLVIIGRK